MVPEKRQKNYDRNRDTEKPEQHAFTEAHTNLHLSGRSVKRGINKKVPAAEQPSILHNYAKAYIGAPARRDFS
jgi:hypothetical protein